MKRANIIVGLVLLVPIACTAQSPQSYPRRGITGIVLYPDGVPADHASVEAVTACPEDHVNLVHEATTSETGEFHIPPFQQSDCKRIRLSARKGLWLKTGEDVFYGKQIGTTPIVDLSKDDASQRTEVRLGELGGRVDVRVWDTATRQFIWAAIGVKRLPLPGANYGSMLIATGRDGSADTLLLPAGTYELSLNLFACKDKDFIASPATPIREMVKVEAGKTIAVDMSLDIRRIKPVKAPPNPHGHYCEP